ncbi:helix-turn-helix transcriptional regulator [Bacillus sp. ISL-46]|uniref:helix-turn-helix domain-containing protein n=1 Tax=Bacillus sp. ISL-46 TaxID=2819129 RepID=UPI001BE5F4DD|nr:helix-turn-helix transcriptional regulator [Bacillus sp. ISL-46]MBT2723068.1 helix-turn-helix transcriptional regulator [Bacillus sp. ISL-46]
MYIATPKLNKILEERGLKQIHLAQMTGIPQGTISRFDRSRQHMMSNLITIAKALDLSVEDLFEIEEA